MKRTDSEALVSYPSSDESDTESQPAPPLKKKKLPVLSASLQPPTPVDNPALHQGRTRTSPHVEGQFAAYVYVPVVVDARSTLGKLLDEVASHAKEITPELWDVGFLDNHEEGDVDVEGIGKRRRTKGERELHVSLSRPTYLRAHQREELKRAVRALAKSHIPFKASFATFSELTNDEQTRTFLTLEVGAGHNELRSLSEALTPTLHSLRQKEFYTDPRFHASIAWALLDAKSDAAFSGSKSIPESLSVLETERHLQGSITSAPSNSVLHRTQIGASTLTYPPASTSPQEPTSDAPTVPKYPLREFPTIPHLPPTLIPTLNAKYTAELTRANVGVFEVGEVRVKIGKWVGGWALQG
ncbi:hypothetical protein PILCRDRAFT_98387 [Piloderma croceum F 1598]|uniref:U6 snRNA phosphodiesterase 1 n=1 Tax=Piloderma croceum (strain F 1598) TaxID=765440 RepID=A0A0C3AWV0_PILCF|nr:hypothetical protein PILCRDRAFT_98387 [Piloderma croceum F 1598]